jgi:RimJ/RimL family protein N-acetyltransferase
MTNPFLIGDQIYLRPLERSDAAIVQPWLNDPDVTRTLRSTWPVSLRGEEDFIDAMHKSERDLVLVIMLKEPDAAIGLCGLHAIDPVNRHAEFGILIGDKSQWGKGHGGAATRLMVRHAFETLNLNRVHLHVFAHHETAQRAYEKAGFVKEGVLRQYFWREGRWHDVIAMAILRDEWISLSRESSP